MYSPCSEITNDANSIKLSPLPDIIKENNDEEIISTVLYNDIRVTQKINFCQDAKDSIVTYDVTNDDRKDQDFSLCTSWGSPWYIPYNLVYTSENGEILKETYIPVKDFYLKHFHADQGDLEHIVPRADIAFSSDNPMDSIKVLSYSIDNYRSAWHTEPSESNSINEYNREIVYKWNEKTLIAGETRTYKLRFDLSSNYLPPSLSGPETDEDDTDKSKSALAMYISGDFSNYIRNNEKTNFRFRADLKNLSNAEQTNVDIYIKYPEYLEPDNDCATKIRYDKLSPDEAKTIEWNFICNNKKVENNKTSQIKVYYTSDQCSSKK